MPAARFVIAQIGDQQRFVKLVIQRMTSHDTAHGINLNYATKRRSIRSVFNCREPNFARPHGSVLK